MEFDKSKVFTALNADEVKVGSKGYYADTIKDLRDIVEQEYGGWCYREIEKITEDSYSSRFKIKDNCCYTFFYLVEEPKGKKLRPYKDTGEMINHFCQHFKLAPQEHCFPVLWIKNNYNKYLITRIGKDTVTLSSFEPKFYTTTLDTLLDDGYTWLDGSPCGIEE